MDMKYGVHAYIIFHLYCIGKNNIAGYFKVDFPKLYLEFYIYSLSVNSKGCNIAILSEFGTSSYSLKILTNVYKN